MASGCAPMKSNSTCWSCSPYEAGMYMNERVISLSIWHGSGSKNTVALSDVLEKHEEKHELMWAITFIAAPDALDVGHTHDALLAVALVVVAVLAITLGMSMHATRGL